ncbi:MAG: type VI secretion system baseplate subunit TssG [Alphaproteobacteria bacterium]|nr:type VI secretion system baseplate subunit TssG [Alphaproteobacteria bacterium]
MGAELRKQSLSLNDDLEKNACHFSFEMAAYILEYGSDISFGKNVTINQAPFRTVSINSFYLRGTEIEKIDTIDGLKTIFIERLAISGLNAPLPTPYGELVLRRNREQDNAMSSFINIFNSRLLGISYQISKRRYLNLQNHKMGNCMFVKTIAAFCGENFKNMSRRLSKISYLFWNKEKSASGLKSLITSLFGFQTEVVQFQSKWTDIEDKNILAQKQLKLGINSGLGTKALVSNIGIKINLNHSDYKRIYTLLNYNHIKNEFSENEIDQLKYIVRKYISAFYLCHVAITPQTVPSLELGISKNNKLGRTTWIPYRSDTNNFCKFDSVKIFI